MLGHTYKRLWYLLCFLISCSEIRNVYIKWLAQEMVQDNVIFFFTYH